MRILFITNLLPYPLDNGGKIKTYNMLKMISKNNTVDLCCFYESDNELKFVNNIKKVCDDIYPFKKKITTSTNFKYMIGKAFRSLFSFKPMTVIKFEDDGLKEKIRELEEENNYDVIYIDHLQLATYLNNSKTEFKILDEHNCESTIIKRTFNEEKNFAKKVFLWLEYKKLESFERKNLEKADRIVVLSKEDKDTLELLSPSCKKDDKFEIIPIPVECNFVKNSNYIKDKEQVKIMFLGTLSWNPNKEAIIWFLKNVMPKLNERYQLYIVGKDPSREILEESEKFKNVTITGYVDDVNEYIELCDLMVVPIFIGSGLRVKILEALGKGIPVISTQIGAEGIDTCNGKNIIISNNEQDFIDGIESLKDDGLYKKIKMNGMKTYKEEYSFDAVCDRVSALFKKL